MKKWTAVLLGAILLVGLTACGNDKNTNGGNTKAADQSGASQTADKAAALPTVDEFIQKSTEASKGLKNFSMDAQIKQNIVIKQGEQKQEQKIDIKSKIDMTKDPLQMVQEMQMTLPGQPEQSIKQYVTKDGVFMQINGQWTKLPAEATAEITAQMEGSANPEKQLEQFKTIAKDTKVSEAGGEYVLAAELSGNGVKELAKSLMSQAGNNPQTASMLEQMNIKSIKMSYAVNKATFLPTKSDVNMVMDMEQDGQNVTLDMVITGAFSKHNEVGEIKVPQEALNAK
ncbi:DUF6612 family protein [Paenibacillus sp. 481]|uniref:DUF6612 family protein n=1 Tax=Paenibacillus sp. 481 TaxID=2835869 RepID=UPI001E380A5E|nr:DUF6612 family protein [Paenibacillus sp. 481]UHA73666.1 hypothetical protein KIK04_00345 [Paenibacillus sp. 481]